MKTQRLYCFSFKAFEYYFERTMDVPHNAAIISICSSGSEKEYHIFHGDRVLNLDFDDITYAMDGYEEFTKEMADDVVKFIEKNIDKDFYIHCSAGISRSQAVTKFIHLNYDRNWELNPRNSDYLFANGMVYQMLCEAHRKLYPR